jgi:hypothetical protein
MATKIPHAAVRDTVAGSCVRAKTYGEAVARASVSLER